MAKSPDDIKKIIDRLRYEIDLVKKIFPDEEQITFTGRTGKLTHDFMLARAYDLLGEHTDIMLESFEYDDLRAAKEYNQSIEREILNGQHDQGKDMPTYGRKTSGPNKPHKPKLN